MINKTREFAPADRYVYDMNYCTTSNGFAQIDTEQDASYFGTWCNPSKRVLFSYCEGDTCLTECDTDDEFIAEVRAIDEWNREMGFKKIGIDPGFCDDLKQAFVNLGLSDLLH